MFVSVNLCTKQTPVTKSQSRGQTAEKQILPSSAAIIWPARPQFLEVSSSALLKVCKQFILIIDVNFHVEVIENKSLHAFIKKLI